MNAITIPNPSKVSTGCSFSFPESAHPWTDAPDSPRHVLCAAGILKQAKLSSR
jgi:hypothetical protein